MSIVICKFCILPVFSLIVVIKVFWTARPTCAKIAQVQIRADD